MVFHDPALVVAFFFAAGDRQGSELWEVVQSLPPTEESVPRRKSTSTAGATVVQVELSRRGGWEIQVWQQLSDEMGRWLGTFWDRPPESFWGVSQVYLGAVAAGPYEEQNLLAQALGLSQEAARPVVLLPVGRVWLVSAPAMVERGAVTAAYAWFYAPTEGVRQGVESLLWEDNASFMRAELYLHRALHQLRQYGREERAAFWSALDRLENTALAALAGESGQPHGSLREASRVAGQGLARLSRRHNLLRSSSYLYGQIGRELRQDGEGFFSWYEERLQEALVQWGYDLERADRAVQLARMAWLSQIEASGREQPPSGRRMAGRPRECWAPVWWMVLLGAAILALCLVDRDWVIVLLRAAVTTVLFLLGWLLLRRWQDSP
ncbi:MAG: hypothetical protein JXA37_02160 [Chloroflexia bacterium]|nr:hypothetical protein [Chloroflexia bacterium]